MKKVLSFSVLTAVLCLCVGCASNQTSTAASTANTPLTLDEALQKSAQARQKVQEAKETYQSVKSAAQASQKNGTSVETELAKQAVQRQIDGAKKQVNDEVQAWKDVMKN